MLLSTFSITLTTMALDQSRLWRFATCSCKPVAGGLLPSLTPLTAAHRHNVTWRSQCFSAHEKDHFSLYSGVLQLVQNRAIWGGICGQGRRACGWLVGLAQNLPTNACPARHISKRDPYWINQYGPRTDTNPCAILAPASIQSASYRRCCCIAD